MTLRDRFTPGEDVVARAGPFYATTRRIVRYERAPDGSETFVELPYFHVRSIELVRPPNHRVMTTGLVVAIAGLFIGFGIGLYTPFLMIPAGVGMIIYGSVSGKEQYYQIDTGGTPPIDKDLWRVPYRGSMEFIAIVGERSGHRPE